MNKESKHIDKAKQQALINKIERLPFNKQGIIDKAGISTRTFFKFMKGGRARITTYNKIKEAIS